MKVKLIKTNGGVDLESSKFQALSKQDQADKVVLDLKKFAGYMLAKCYTPNTYAEVITEDEKTTFGRANFCIKNGHHSGFDHTQLTFEMDKVPKIIFMLLNNEGVYTTSEQSARYTDFSKAAPTQKERDLYVKWTSIIEGLIENQYPQIDEKQSHKLAQENARYMISVFTPSSMNHTLSLRQLNYIIYFIEKFLESDWPRNKIEKTFALKIREPLEEFLNEIKYYKIEGLIPKPMSQLSFFKSALTDKETFSDVYSIRYNISFAAQAQNHRHRTIRYRAKLLDKFKAYVPPILGNNKEYISEWNQDMRSVKDEFPQGMMIKVTEHGELEDFILKCYERLCGHAQLEIKDLTLASMSKIDRGLSKTNKDIQQQFRDSTNNLQPSRCAFPGYTCKGSCAFGFKQFERKI